jgi:hypothetical protein
MNIRVFVAALLILYGALFDQVLGQADVLAITSFRDCLSLDTSIQNQNLGGVGVSLNCTALPNGVIPPVTTLDLRIVPGLATGSTFNIDLTTVLSNTGGENSTSSSTLRCNTPNPGTQTCFATTSAQMTITTSKPVFAYDLSLRRQRRRGTERVVPRQLGVGVFVRIDG